VKEMGKTEMLLKIVMAPVEQLPSFVDHVAKLIPDCDLNEFMKILDMKGYKRPEQGQFVELFKIRIASTTGRQFGETLELDPTETSVESSRIKKLEKLIKKRL
jgi:hypothetical protein